MKKLILLAGAASVLVLASCADAEPEAPAPTAVETPVSTANVEPGNYDVTWSDGTKSQFTVNDDLSYLAVRNGETVTGTTAIVDGKFCVTSDEPEAQQQCWTNGEATPDGTFASINDDGESVTVRRATPTEIASPAAQ